MLAVAQRHPGSFTGSSDHLVSQAFYFDDPEDNGVELYWDRDRSEWAWVHGQVEMSTLFLDPTTCLRDHLTEPGSAGERIGDASGGPRPPLGRRRGRRPGLLRRHARSRCHPRVRRPGRASCGTRFRRS